MSKVIFAISCQNVSPVKQLCFDYSMIPFAGKNYGITVIHKKKGEKQWLLLVSFLW